MKLEFINNQLIITYNINSQSPADKFRISIEIKKQNGEPIKPNAFTGDIGKNINQEIPGELSGIWGKDSIYLDEDIFVELKGEKIVESYNKGTLILMSTALPGWGQTKMTGKPWWIGGVAAYGALAGGIIFYNKCVNTADLYNDQLTPPEDKAALKDKGNNEFLISRDIFYHSRLNMDRKSYMGSCSSKYSTANKTCKDLYRSCNNTLLPGCHVNT